MVSIRERMNSMLIQTTSTDGNIQGTLKGQSAFKLAFRDECFYTYSRMSLEGQLSQIITELFRGANERRRAILVEVGFTLYDPEKPHWNKRTREVNAKRDSLDYEGVSRSESITVRSSGWKRFNVTIDEQSLEQMEAADFISEVEEAMVDLLIDYRIAERMIKRQVYGYNNGY